MASKKPFPQEEEGESSQPLAKRPRFGNQCYKEVVFHIEPMFRKVIREEFQKALFNFANPTPRTSVNQIHGASRYRLHFQNRLSRTRPLFTNRIIKSENRSSLQLALKDTISNEIVTSDPWASLSVKIVALNGDFNRNEDTIWSKEEFDRHVESAREGKRPLLKGELNVRMSKGVGIIGDVSFTDNSKWTRSGMFRLGAVVSDGRYNGERVQEAITESVQVKDERGEANQKDNPPSLTDQVYRLKGIMKNGMFHQRLMGAGINNVQDFLSLYVVDSHKLRTLLGRGMGRKAWEETVKHAFQCNLGDKLYHYHIANEGITLVFNSIFQIRSVNDHLESDLTPYLKERLGDFKKLAHANQGEIHEHHDTPDQTLGIDLLPGTSSCNLNMHTCLHQTAFHDASTSEIHTLNQVYNPSSEILCDIPELGVYQPHQYDTNQKVGSSTNDGCTGLLSPATNSFQAPISAMAHHAQYVGKELVSTIRNDKIPASISMMMSTDHSDDSWLDQLLQTPGSETTALPNRFWSPLMTLLLWRIKIKRIILAKRFCNVARLDSPPFEGMNQFIC